MEAAVVPTGAVWLVRRARGERPAAALAAVRRIHRLADLAVAALVVVHDEQPPL
jgi:hypothetical protein